MSSSPSFVGRLRRWLLYAAATVLLVSLFAATASWIIVRRSLPVTGGEIDLAGLTSPVEVTFDHRGIPSIRAESFEDGARAQGFVHAQQRFFQMDLTRRAAAGELSALFGPTATRADRRLRVYQHRRRARSVLEALPDPHRRALTAYAEGVNAGLAALGTSPPEYWLLRQSPLPWSEEDSVLVFYSFFITLSDNHLFERPLGVMEQTLSPELFEFLTPRTSRIDAPMGTTADDRTGGHVPVEIPPPDVIDLRGLDSSSAKRSAIRPPVRRRGSNNWAVAGSRTPHGQAIVANDTHLSIRIPNTYFRVELNTGDGWARGASIPGQPGVIIGSTDHLAWGPTAGVLDQTDLVVLEMLDETTYRVPGGTDTLVEHREIIEVAGAEPIELIVKESRWGPILREDWQGRPLALRSTGLDPDGINFELFRVLSATTLEEGIEVFRRWNGPALNWMLASHDGRIGWVVNGRLPNRSGFDGSIPRSWADGTIRWDGDLDVPFIVDPPDGVLWTANNRTLPLDQTEDLSRFWIFPQRAHRIRQVLDSAESFDEQALLDLQLDTAAPTLEPIREILRRLPASRVEQLSPDAQRFLEIVESWNGTADVDQSAFRLIHAYYRRVLPTVLAPLVEPCVAADDGFVYNWSMSREIFLRLAEERPAHMLSTEYEDWDDLFASELERVVESLMDGPHGLDVPWGTVNAARIEHPLGSLPVLESLLNMPDDPLAGWEASVRAQSPSYGATLRLVASPSRLDEAIFHMPGGQSGHFLSDHYDDGHADWVHGNASPLSAGSSRSTLTFRPVR